MKLKLLIAILLVLGGTPIFAQDVVYLVKDVALSGYDAVGYFEKNEAITGKDEFMLTWNGARWKFSSQENLETFKQQPQHFAPQYGGYCAYGASRGYLAKTDPTAFTIIDNKLYLNYSLDVRTEWMNDVTTRIKKADAHWESKLKYSPK